MIPVTKRILCTIMAVLFLLNSCAPAPAATEDPAIAQLQQTVDALLTVQNAQATATPDIEKAQLQQTVDALVAAQNAQAQATPTAPVTQTPDALQQTVDALFATQNALSTQPINTLQQTVEALFATQNALSTQQVALEGLPPAAACAPAPVSTSVDSNAALTIENLYPDVGETYGGKSVTIEGKNLVSRVGKKATFCFGGLQVAEVTVTCPNAERCTMKVPANPKAGPVDVSVLRDGQTDTEADAFEYVNPPKVSLVDPNSGPISGGTSVTVKGSGFSETTKFFFGAGNEARTETCSSNECTVISPGIKSDQDTVVWVQAVEGDAFSELDTSRGTTQTFKYVAPAKYACDAYLIAPGTQGPFQPNESFEIKWVIKNIGANAWPAGQDVKFSSGSSGNMGTVSVVEIKKPLQPNDTFTVAIDAKAPARKGPHHMTWIVAGQGCALYVAIKVE
jgi:hypothetical protein